MSNNALYFPYINLPQDAWSARSLLYWDGLATIVPMDHLDRPEQLSQFMRGLLSEGLVKQVVPGIHLYDCPGFSDHFIEYLEAHRQAVNFKASTQQPFRYTRIHAEKLHRITDYLVQHELASQADYTWYNVREDVARDFMFYLAVTLGALGHIDAVPVTDGWALPGRSPSPSTIRRSPHVRKAREVVLENLLPTPVEGVSVQKLAQFKHRHGHLLPRFRLAVEQHCIQMAGVTNAEERLERTRLFIMDCQEQIKEIESAMKPSFGRIICTSLIPMVAAGLSYSGEGGLQGKAVAALGIIPLAFEVVSQIRAARGANPRQPLAYVAHARKFTVYKTP